MSDDIVARIDALIPADEVNSHPLVWRARNIDLALLIDARNEIRALRAEVERGRARENAKTYWRPMTVPDAAGKAAMIARIDAALNKEAKP